MEIDLRSLKEDIDSFLCGKVPLNTSQQEIERLSMAILYSILSTWELPQVAEQKIFTKEDAESRN